MKKIALITFVFIGGLTCNAQVGPDKMVAHFVEIGQGDFTILEFECGVILIDAGAQTSGTSTSRRKVTDYLESFFNRRTDLNKTIDAIIITHNHFDHSGSLDDIAAEYRVKNLVTTSNRLRDETINLITGEEGMATDMVSYDEVLNNFPHGITNTIIDPIACSTDPKVTVFTGKVQFDPGWGRTYGRPRWQHPNYNSLVIRVDFGKASFLFTGDLQDRAIDYMLEKYKTNLSKFDVDVYQVGHHASHNATTEGLMNAMTPEFSIISASKASTRGAGTGYAYGHPNTDIVQLLQGKTSGIRGQKLNDAIVFNGGWDRSTSVNNNDKKTDIEEAVYCTCWDGTIKLSVNKNGKISKL